MSDKYVRPVLYKSSLLKIFAKGYVIQGHGMIISLFSMNKMNTYSSFEVCLICLVFFHLTVLLTLLNH